MKKGVVLLILLVNIVLLTCLSIYDVQFTNDPGFDGTYPSQYSAQTVQIEGIIFAIDKNQSRYFITDNNNSAWSDICVLDPFNRFKIADKVLITGKIIENHGMTCIKSESSRLISTNCQLPTPLAITLLELNSEESFESALVKVNDVTLIKSQKVGFQYEIKDFNNQSLLGNSINYINTTKKISFNLGTAYSSIIGIVCFTNNQFSINPRSSEDFNISSVNSHSASWGKIKSLYR